MLIEYNKEEDPSKTLDSLCVILKARMSIPSVVDRYEHRDDYYQHMWNDYSKDLWDNSPYNKGGR